MLSVTCYRSFQLSPLIDISRHSFVSCHLWYLDYFVSRVFQLMETKLELAVGAPQRVLYQLDFYEIIVVTRVACPEEPTTYVHGICRFCWCIMYVRVRVTNGEE